MYSVITGNLNEPRAASCPVCNTPVAQWCNAWIVYSKAAGIGTGKITTGMLIGLSLKRFQSIFNITHSNTDRDKVFTMYYFLKAIKAWNSNLTLNGASLNEAASMAAAAYASIFYSFSYVVVFTQEILLLPGNTCTLSSSLWYTVFTSVYGFLSSPIYGLTLISVHTTTISLRTLLW